MKEHVLMNGDCLELLEGIPDKSVSMILADLPYGTTACKWDIVIPFDKLWHEYERVIKEKAVIALFGTEPFSSYLRLSKLNWWKYDFIWKKTKGCNFTHANNMPIKFHEIISIFSPNKIGHIIQLNEKRMTYYPQGLIKVDKKWSRPRKYENGHKLKRNSHSLQRIIEFENYPTSILDFTNSNNKERGLHPTQKPVALLEYLIKTYTNEGDTVLDNVMGSGSTGVACKNTGRNFIGMEIDNHYFSIAESRIAQS